MSKANAPVDSKTFFVFVVDGGIEDDTGGSEMVRISVCRRGRNYSLRFSNIQKSSSQSLVSVVELHLHVASVA